MLGQQYPDVPYIGPARVHRVDDDGEPRTSRKRWAVAHCTDNDADDTGEAQYALRRTDAGSHYYLDRDSITQALHTSYQAGHVGSLTGNTYGIAYEFVGRTGWTREKWLSSISWDLAGRQLARDSIFHGFPLTALTQPALERGEHGVITHDMARLAWGGTDHTDPGPGFPMDRWIQIARNYLEAPVKFYRVSGTPEVYAYAGALRMHVPDEPTLKRLQSLTGAGPVIVLDNAAQLDIVAPEVSLALTDEQLDRVLRKIIFG